MKMLTVSWRKALLTTLAACALALALWAALTTTQHQHRAVEGADVAFEAVHMTAHDPARRVFHPIRGGWGTCGWSARWAWKRV